MMRHLRSVAAYGLTSIGATIVEFTVLHAALALAVVSPVAVSIGYGSGSIFQFCMLRYVVFRVTHKPAVFQINAYIAVALFAWLCVLGAVAAIQGLFHAGTFVARAISVPLLFPLNYLLSRYVIFRR